MSCKVCDDLEILEKVSRDISGGLKYCPACGASIAVMDIIRDAKAMLDKMCVQAAYEKALSASKTVVVDGEELIFERQESDSEKKSTPLDMRLNLDNVDISKEQSWLEFMGMASEIKKKKEESDA